MKKTFRKLGMATALVLAMVGFAACGDDDDDDKGKEEVIDAGSIEGLYHFYKYRDEDGTITEKEDPEEFEDENIKVIKKSNNEFLLCWAEGDTYYEDDLVGILKFDDELLTNHEYLISEEYGDTTYIKITGKDAFEIRIESEEDGVIYEYYKKISK